MSNERLEQREMVTVNIPSDLMSVIRSNPGMCIEWIFRNALTVYLSESRDFPEFDLRDDAALTYMEREHS